MNVLSCHIERRPEITIVQPNAQHPFFDETFYDLFIPEFSETHFLYFMPHFPIHHFLRTVFAVSLPLCLISGRCMPLRECM